MYFSVMLVLVQSTPENIIALQLVHSNCIGVKSKSENVTADYLSGLSYYQIGRYLKHWISFSAKILCIYL